MSNLFEPMDECNNRAHCPCLDRSFYLFLLHNTKQVVLYLFIHVINLFISCSNPYYCIYQNQSSLWMNVTIELITLVYVFFSLFLLTVYFWTSCFMFIYLCNQHHHHHHHRHHFVWVPIWDGQPSESAAGSNKLLITVGILNGIDHWIWSTD